jgi:PAS domain S-box-containing protein
LINKNISLVKFKKGLGIPLPYFLIVFTICIIPTVCSVLKIDLTYRVISNGTSLSSREYDGMGGLFNSIWVLFSIATSIFTFILTLIDFRVKRDLSAPIIGITLLCIAILDMLHLLIAAGTVSLHLSFADSLYITWFISRFLTGMFLIAGTGLILLLRIQWISRTEQKLRLLKLLSCFYFIILFFCLTFIFSIKDLPSIFKQQSGFINHPAEFIIIALFFFWGAVIMPKIIKTFPGIFSHLLILTLIPAVFAAIHMSVSLYPFDTDFNVAQFFKLFSLIIPLIGLTLNYSQNIAKQHDQNLRLDKEVQDRQKIQIDLEGKQNLLKHAEDIASMGSWELAINREMVWSDSLYKILGLSPSTKPNLNTMLEMVEISFKKKLETAINDSFKNLIPFLVEYQIKRADNSIRYIQGQGQFIQESKKIIGTCLDITDLKETTYKLEQNEALLKEAESISHNGSFEWNGNLKSLFWSDELYRIHGFTPNSITVDLGFYKTLIHPDDLERCVKTFTRAFSFYKNFMVEYRIIRPNGEIRYLYGNVRFIKDDNSSEKVLGTVQDITELKNTTILLEKTESIYKTIAKNVPDSAVMMYDREYNLILFEGPIINSFSFKNEPVIGLNVINLYDDKSYKKVQQYLKKAFDGEETQYTEEIGVRHYKTNYVPVKNITEEIFSVMIVKQDISEIKAVQQDLEFKVEELNRSNQDLEQFAYVASHDLQEPLRKIRAFVDKLQDKFSKEITEDGLDYIKRTQNASKRMQNLIDDLLTYSRVTRDDISLEVIDLQEQIQKVVEDLDFIIEKKNAKINLEVSHKINAAPGQIRQLFQNLISNAIKFTKKDDAPFIEIKSEKIQGDSTKFENLNPAKDYCQITIKDNGIGFDEQYSDKIFALFYRLHTRAEYLGTGIGLAVCKKIVEKHNGQIHVNSKTNIGTTFTMIFPLA